MRISDWSSDVCSSDLTKEVEDYSGWQDHVVGLPTAEELRAGLPAFKPNCIEPAFSPAFFVRMLFSCLVDADFLETEAFYARSRGEEVPKRGGALAPEHIEQIGRAAGRERVGQSV